MFADAGIKLVNPYAFSLRISNEKPCSSTVCAIFLLFREGACVHIFEADANEGSSKKRNIQRLRLY